MNWFILILTAVVLIFLVAFMIRKNNRDRKSFEKKLNREYDKPEKHSSSEEHDDVQGG